MKKSILFAASAAMILSLASCSEESKDERTVSAVYKAYNLFNLMKDQEEAYVLAANYTFTTKYPDQTIVASASGMSLPGGGNASFTTKEIPFSTMTVGIGESYANELLFSSAEASGNGDEVKDLSANITSAFYAPVGSLTAFPQNAPSSGQIVLMDYYLGDKWRVRSFWPDMTFRGETITEYPGMTEHYQTDEIAYRVVIKEVDGGTSLFSDKADVIFYNARFAQTMPITMTIILKDVNLVFNKAGFTLSGTNLVPYMPEGDSLTPYEKFTFDKFELNCVGDLTRATAEYKVAGIYNGQFSGRSILSSK